MKNHVFFKVFIALLLAIIVGWNVGPEEVWMGIPLVKICGLIGQLFLNGLYLVAVPLVAASIILGTARMGSQSSFGVLGAKTFGFYFLTSSFAVLVGIGGFFFIYSALFSDISVAAVPTNGSELLQVNLSGDLFDTFSQIFLKFVPSNILAAASQGQMLGLIFFSIFFGFFLSKIESSQGEVILKFWEGIFQIMMKMTHLIMKALPIGVFGLVTKVVATTGVDAMTSAGWYFLTVVLSLLFFSFVVIPLLVLLIGRMNPVDHFRALFPALFTAFSTSSSAATLPITMECVEIGLGVSNRICSFSIPLGTSINMSGGALNMTIASLFIASMYGISLSMTTVSLIGVMALLTSMGVAGIPSASLISVALILNTVGVPAEGIGLIIAVDRILDMCRTTVNVLGNSTCAVLISRTEGEQAELQLI